MSINNKFDSVEYDSLSDHDDMHLTKLIYQFVNTSGVLTKQERGVITHRLGLLGGHFYSREGTIWDLYIDASAKDIDRIEQRAMRKLKKWAEKHEKSSKVEPMDRRVDINYMCELVTKIHDIIKINTI